MYLSLSLSLSVCVCLSLSVSLCVSSLSVSLCVCLLSRSLSFFVHYICFGAGIGLICLFSYLLFCLKSSNMFLYSSSFWLIIIFLLFGIEPSLVKMIPRLTFISYNLGQLRWKLWCSVNITRLIYKLFKIWGAAIAQWIRLRLPSSPLGLSPKHTINAFIIYSQTCAIFVMWKERQ